MIDIFWMLLITGVGIHSGTMGVAAVLFQVHDWHLMETVVVAVPPTEEHYHRVG